MTASPWEAGRIPLVPLAEARADLPKLANLAHYTGRPTILTRYGKPWAVIAPVSALAHLADAPPEGSEDVVEVSERLAALGGSTVTSESILAALRDIREEQGEGEA
ncbi:MULTISPECIES: type II toxin-antitoxin system Phd/YefM family antitoxin [Streptomyces]|uniref:Antitoxin Phd_YefM, type II toxin-antitoxin system n=1 Tax=Streptomyces pini TaxID=1520580 RepID=A0A1I3U207_9ACTN|nr:type II toxin-antitoxin system Phd/YefM family antitoxin [Streptomyces pini]SFJ76559.1 Antitoxin Phd_YefM, type II toxin-antitoxin system [Streptomyces pini]